MWLSLYKRPVIVAWQLIILILGTTWLLAPLLNHQLSYRTTLISQYETSFEPYSWLFRSGDVLAGLLILLAGIFFLKNHQDRIISWLLIVVGAGLLFDPVLATSCHQIADTCQEYFSFSFVLHAIETVITSLSIFAIAVYDAYLRKRVVSIMFASFQVAYGLLFVSQFANHEHFNTFSQYIYVLSIIIWLAWFVRDFLSPNNFTVKASEIKWANYTASAWAFLNGIAAILISLAHIRLLGRIKDLYFIGDNAWLAQHGVIVGTVMLYLSRHLARGERRARQIFLALLGLEVVKYSLISPDAQLLLLYGISFACLFVLRDDFRRGTVPLTRNMRLKDLYFMLGGLTTAIIALAISLDRDSHVSKIAGRAIDHLIDYTTGSDNHIASHIRSVLLAQTLTVFLTAATVMILWILFKPFGIRSSSNRDYRQAEKILKQYSNSSEDYFKLWPGDKDFYWSADMQNLVAYKRSGAVVFALDNPIGPKTEETLSAFIDWAHGHRLKVCFMPVYEKSAEMYKKAGLNLFKIGSSAVIDTQEYLSTTANDKWWRWIKNKSVRAGYEYQNSTPPHSTELIKELAKVSKSWLDIGQHRERGFALGYFDNYYINQCRVHYIKQEGKIIAFTNEVPQFKKMNTRTIDLMRYLPDHNQSMPYLLFNVIESCKNLGIEQFDLGFVPFAGAKGPIQAIAQQFSDRRFSSHGLMQFKNKFDPKWEPNYLAYDGDLADLGLIALNVDRVMEL